MKVRARTTAEAVIGAVTGARTSPSTLLLGRADASGRLRLIARTTPLPTAARRDLGTRVRPCDADHPWRGRRFSAGWGSRGELEFAPVHPDVVVEFLADTTVDDGRYRHPVRFLRVREDLTADQLPLLGA
ncbi:hypothetical protein [Streptomyces sp. Root1310]|uniref:hypothetical protein n=1 Tax=Streptomyces sp. Root1310 TaxID=1736452 RepID=UPI000709AFFE|nr:hypothetical protein [Streptomyces sp. Root1310]KQX65209.1 hypothetical protein ASD48_19215 [Streptomyces sp. Root1310]